MEPLIRKHAHHVYLLANYFRPAAALRGIEYEDLVQEGFVGLLIAVKEFMPDKGGDFMLFALPRVRWQMVKSMRANPRLACAKSASYEYRKDLK